MGPVDPIARRLIPGDEVVIIHPLEGGDAITPGAKLSVEQVIEDVALRSDIVAVIELETVEGVLARDGAWVDTRVAGTVRDVLRVSKNHRIARATHRGVAVRRNGEGGECRGESRPLGRARAASCAHVVFVVSARRRPIPFKASKSATSPRSCGTPRRRGSAAPANPRSRSAASTARAAHRNSSESGASGLLAGCRRRA